MTQPRRPAGTPVGDQLAPTNHPEASGIELAGDRQSASVPVGLDADWAKSQRQQARLVELADPRPELGSDASRDGTVHLLDDIQDQGAEVLGEEAVFGELGGATDALWSMGETETCDECGAELVVDELVTDQHETWCSLHPDNVVDAPAGALPHADDPRVESSGGVDEYRRFVQQSGSGSTSLSAPAPAPTTPVPPAHYASLREALDAENAIWTWTGIAAEIGKEQAAKLFERSGGSLGTALALANAAGSIASAAAGETASGEQARDGAGGSPVALQAQSLASSTTTLIGELRRFTADIEQAAAETLERQHQALRGIQALLSDPEWDSPADRLEWIATLIEGAGYAHETYRPEAGEQIELQLEDRSVVGRIEHIDGDETLVVPSGGGRPVKVQTAAIEWDRDNQTWVHAPELE